MDVTMQLCFKFSMDPNPKRLCEDTSGISRVPGIRFYEYFTTKFALDK